MDAPQLHGSELLTRRLGFGWPAPFFGLCGFGGVFTI